MNSKKVTCLDLRKYNQVQLTKVSEVLGVVDGQFQDLKKDGVLKIFLDNEARAIIGQIVKDTHNYSRSYKGLVLSSEYSYLSRREIDFLLKMQPTDIELKKAKTSTEKVSESKTSKNAPVENLDLDAILDKITDFGIDSLTLNEKKFLDNISRK